MEIKLQKLRKANKALNTNYKVMLDGKSKMPKEIQYLQIKRDVRKAKKAVQQFELPDDQTESKSESALILQKEKDFEELEEMKFKETSLMLSKPASDQITHKAKIKTIEECME